MMGSGWMYSVPDPALHRCLCMVLLYFAPSLSSYHGWAIVRRDRPEAGNLATLPELNLRPQAASHHVMWRRRCPFAAGVETHCSQPRLHRVFRSRSSLLILLHPSPSVSSFVLLSSFYFLVSLILILCRSVDAIYRNRRSISA
ncbi:hypothetical protein BP00DRAFT_228762 [Aspergillus indologenus CBS 114.80]|uniref:Uncharacterized protein n=1 Tax=Aspergillus indologenus CBS 114.80 TaxID=1450541 RepID=A0A2V5IZ83_9EURO|nr:hypothetical protein BP00DRAFT_228762 [Aspergillus indologenus CBS 114.80]